MKQGEAVEIAAKQIYVYNIKMKLASRQASRSPALWRARSRESKQALALEIAAKQLRQVSTMRTWSKTSNLSTATCMPTKCKQPKQAIHADRNQEIQRPQTNANKTFSRQRFCVWRQTCFIMAPKTGSEKLVETWRPERDLDCTRNKLGRTERKSVC